MSLALLTAALLFAAAPSTAPATRPAASVDVPAGYKLLWHDEFDGSGLPDPAKWRFEGGLLRNHEEQLYTIGRTENARQEDGHLILTARRERVANPRHDPAAPGDDWQRSREFADYTSADLDTLGKFAFTYGRVEARAKMPKGKGMWPAFWMLGENIQTVSWPRCGEVDVMEWVGKDPRFFHATVHYADPKVADRAQHASKGTHTEVADEGGEFHVFAAEWTPDRMDFSVDGTVTSASTSPTPTRSAPTAGRGPQDNPFRRPQYLLLNFAVGGDWGGPVDAGVFPQQYVVDYVRVFQRAQAR